MKSKPDIGQDYNPETHKTYIIFENALLLLFTICRFCCAPTADVSKTIQGSFLKIRQQCSKCHHLFVWESQPFHGNIPAGNIITSAAILFTGLLPGKALRMLQVLNCASISRKTFFRHQSSILQPSIQRVWNRQQQSLFDNIISRNHHLILAGDGRSDSPGHSAKYGSYTVIDMTLNKVVDFRLVQVNHISQTDYEQQSLWCYLFRAMK